MSAKIIFFEGSDYAGKSTQIEKIRKYLTSHNYKVKVMREPGSTVGMNSIRERLLDKDMNNEEPLNYLSRRLLYAADHAQCLEHIKQNKDKYDYILVDRFTVMSDLIFGPLSNDGGDDAYIASLKIAEDMAKFYDIYFNANGGNPIRNATLVVMTITEETLLIRNAKRNSEKYESNILDEKSDIFKKSINNMYNKIADIIDSGVMKYSMFNVFFKTFAHKIIIKADGGEGQVFDNILISLGIKGE